MQKSATTKAGWVACQLGSLSPITNKYDSGISSFASTFHWPGLPRQWSGKHHRDSHVEACRGMPALAENSSADRPLLGNPSAGNRNPSPDIPWAENASEASMPSNHRYATSALWTGPLQIKRRPNANVTAALGARLHHDGHGVGTAHVGTRRPPTQNRQHRHLEAKSKTNAVHLAFP